MLDTNVVWKEENVLSKTKITEREYEILLFITKYTNANAVSPSMREIASGVQLASVSNAHRYVHSLMDKGLLKVITSPCGRVKSIMPQPEEYYHGTQKSLR